MSAPVIAGVPTDCLKPSDLLWASLLDKPLLFPPNAHSHGSGDLPGNIAFKDQANTFTANQTVTGTITASGAVAASAISESSVAATGTGGLVRAVSPTLVTPNLGTPSALVVTNASGTASININGTVGATTRNMGAFTNATAAQFLDDTAIGGVASYGTFQLGFFGVSPAGWSHPSGGTFRGLIQHGNNGCYWTAYGTGLASGTVTYGLQPAATGGVALEINNGTAGTFRDLNLRNLTASGTLAASGATSLKNLTVQGIAGGYETILQLKDSSAANIGSIHAYAGEAIFQAAQFVALSTIGLSRHRLANDGLFIPDGSGGTGAQSKIFFGDTYNSVYPTAITAAAGVVQINNGTTGTLRDLNLRNLTASGNIIAKGSVTTDATLGYVNVRMGAGGTNPRLILDGGTSGAITQFENNSGLTRILSDSAVLLSIANSTGALTIPGTVTINSTGGSSPTLALNYNGTPWYNYVNSSDYYSFAKQGSANVLTLKQNIGVDVTGNITASGTVSSPQNSTGERFGVGTTANYAGVAVGYGASAGWSGIAIGMQASTATSYGSGGIAIGYQAYSVENAVAIGSRTNNGTANTCLIGNITVPLSLVVPNGNITASGIIKQLGANGQYLQLDLSVAGAYSYPKLQTNSDNLTIQNATQSLTLGGSYYAFTSNGILSLNLPSAYGDAGAVFRRASPAGGGNLAAFYDYGNTLKVSISETGNITTSGTVTSAFQSLSTDPTGADLATGLTRIIKNTSSGTTKIWLNDGGTFKSLTFV